MAINVEPFVSTQILHNDVLPLLEVEDTVYYNSFVSNITPYMKTHEYYWMNDNFIIPYYTPYTVTINGVEFLLSVLFENVAIPVDNEIIVTMYKVMEEINQNILLRRSMRTHTILVKILLRVISKYAAIGVMNDYVCGGDIWD
jgi:hypothetical protein